MRKNHTLWNRIKRLLRKPPMAEQLNLPLSVQPHASERHCFTEQVLRQMTDARARRAGL